MRYSELKYDGQTYEEQWKIDEILIKNKFNWIVNAEIENARLEIYKDTLVWNGGTWYNGNWYFGVWRDGAWKYGTWENGVWYGGRWENGTFKSGIIFKGNFFKGKIEGGEIRGGNFINVQISPNVIEYTGDEYQANQQDKQAQVQKTTTQAQSQNTNQVKVHSTPPAVQQQAQVQEPKIQMEKLITKFETFINESVNEDDFYELLEFLDSKNEKLEKQSDDFTNYYINYNIINNKKINLSLGWNSPEEFMKLDALIELNNNICTLKGSQEGSSVYSEDGNNYINNYDYSFNTIEELIDFLDKEI